MNYYSKSYKGKSSDKVIVEQSSLIESMQQPDTIIVDKGFLIDDIYTNRRFHNSITFF